MTFEDGEDKKETVKTKKTVQTVATVAWRQTQNSGEDTPVIMNRGLLLHSS